jgi:hypothetical protein
MSADANPVEYWTPATPLAAHAPGRPLFTGPQGVGCFTMLGVLAVATALAFGIVTVLAWVLA